MAPFLGEIFLFYRYIYIYVSFLPLVLLLNESNTIPCRVSATRIRPGAARAEAIPPPGGSGWYPTYLLFHLCINNAREGVVRRVDKEKRIGLITRIL